MWDSKLAVNINIRCFSNLFIELMDAESDNFLDIDLSEYSGVSVLANKYLMPSLAEFSEAEREMLKLCISYYLGTGKVNLDRFFGANHIPLTAPDDQTAFLGDLWKALFKDSTIPNLRIDEVEVFDY
jgi:hypothetical protein